MHFLVDKGIEGNLNPKKREQGPALGPSEPRIRWRCVFNFTSCRSTTLSITSALVAFSKVHAAKQENSAFGLRV